MFKPLSLLIQNKLQVNQTTPRVTFTFLISFYFAEDLQEQKTDGGPWIAQLLMSPFVLRLAEKSVVWVIDRMLGNKKL